MAMSALQIGFPLGCDECVVMAMVGEYQRVGVMLTIERSRLVKNSKLICLDWAAWPLACVRRGFPIVGVPMHPRGGGGVVSVGCSLLMWI